MRRRNLVSSDLGAAGSRSSQDEVSFATVRRKLPRLVSKIDFYPKLHEDVRVRTRSGGVLTVAVALLAMALFMSELSIYLTPTKTSHVSVDDTLSERLRVNINVSFWALACDRVELVAMDVAGEATLNVEGLLHKVRLSENGAVIDASKITKSVGGGSNASDTPPALPDDYCGSCYGAKRSDQAPCCNTCDHVIEAYDREGGMLWLYSRRRSSVRERLHRAGSSRGRRLYARR